MDDTLPKEWWWTAAHLGCYWVVYTLLLLILMRLLRWRVGLFPLLVSTALATGLAQIPVVGPWVATPVLVLCIWKASRSDLTDSLFSVVIAGAFMFAFQLLVLTALLGEVRLAWGDRQLEPEDPTAIIEVPAAVAWDGPRGKDKALLYLKGITVSSNQTMVLIGSGTAHYPFTNGESAIIRSPKGRLAVFCESIDDEAAVMLVDWNDRKYRLTLLLPTADSD